MPFKCRTNPTDFQSIYKKMTLRFATFAPTWPKLGLTVPTLRKVVQKVYLSYVEVGKVSPKLLSLIEN